MRECKSKSIKRMHRLEKRTIGAIGRTIMGFVILFSILWMYSLGIQAETGDAVDTTMIVSGDYKYKLLEDGTVELCEYHGTGGEIKVPARMDGKEVSRLGEFLFENNLSITKVTIEDGIKEIGKGCFDSCENIVSVYMPDSVEEMGLFSFFLNSKLKKIKLSQNITCIQTGTFCWCTSLVDIEIPNKVTMIDFLAFGNCTGLKELILPDCVTILNNSAFYRCTELQRIRISPKTMGIVNEAFMDTDKLTWITTIDWRKLQIADYAPKISIFSEKQCICIGDYAFSNSLLNQGVIIADTNGLGTDVFSPSTILYGKPGTNVQSYAITNHLVFKEYIPVERIHINQSSVNLNWNSNNSLKLTHSVTPASATITQIGYYSSNPKVATVDGEGNIRALSEGKALITAVSLENDSITTSCQVTVTTALKSMSLSKKTMTIYPGKKNEKQLIVTTSPQNINRWKVNWKSSNTKVAIVDQKGKVIGLRPGTAIITTTCSNKKVSCRVIVRPSDLQEIRMISQTTSTVNLKWRQVTGVTGYRLYGYNAKVKKYQIICDIKGTKNAYTLKTFVGKKKLTSGTSYHLYLKPYKIINKVRYYGKGAKLQVVTKPDKVITTSVGRVGTSKNKGWMIKWKKVKGASGYKVYVSTNKGKTYKRVAIIKNSKQTSYQYKKGRRRTTYYIKISAYKSIGKKTIGGATSKTRSIRIY